MRQNEGATLAYGSTTPNKAHPDQIEAGGDADEKADWDCWAKIEEVVD